MKRYHATSGGKFWLAYFLTVVLATALILHLILK